MATWRSAAHRDTWRAYFEASLLLQTRLDEDLRACAGMAMIDYHLLLLLAEAPGHRLRMGELAARMVFSASRLTYQVNAMQRRGWVLRQPSEDDRRVTYAVLTASGLEAWRHAGRHHARTVRTLFTDDLDDTELNVLADVFGRLGRRLAE